MVRRWYEGRREVLNCASSLSSCRGWYWGKYRAEVWEFTVGTWWGNTAGYSSEKNPHGRACLMWSRSTVWLEQNGDGEAGRREDRRKPGQIMETYEAISQVAACPLRSMGERQQSSEHKRNMLMTYSLRRELKNIFCKEPESIHLGCVVHMVSAGTTRLCHCQWKEL